MRRVYGGVGSGGNLEIVAPATGRRLGEVPELSAAEVAELVARGRAAQPRWEAMGFDGRAAALKRLRRWLVRNRDEVMGLVMDETGKTREDAVLGELWLLADSLGHWARTGGRLLADERVRSHSPLMIGKKLVVRYRPVGVVGVIAPWNYPLALGVGDAVPALMAGNSVVLKPSEFTPFASLRIAEGARECGVPEDVFTIATGAGDTGAALVDQVDMVMFTGSTETGRKIAARAAERLIPVSLELGGKDPMIVLRDADLDRAATVAVQWAFANSGQLCMSVERVYVEEPVHDAFVERVVAATRGLRQGPPGEAGSVDIGAMTRPEQAELVEEHVRDAVERGAKVAIGGHRRQNGGHYFEPTVVTGVDHDMLLMRDETFGPTLPIMSVRDEREAIELANASPYGLNSSVFTRDLEKGERIARQLETGNACVNDACMNMLAQEVPFTGSKQSGLGSRHGAMGIRKYCEPQTILVTRFGPRHEPTFYPYKRGITKAFEWAMQVAWGR
jgi:acyl-CoA reductase-like NAD-dependent aldehyde dehydrogenase